MTTKAHEMDKRIRFGSDGNGIFVAVSRDGGVSWTMFDDARRFAARTRRILPADEFNAGYRFLTCEWHPSQGVGEAVAVAS